MNAQAETVVPRHLRPLRTIFCFAELGVGEHNFVRSVQTEIDFRILEIEGRLYFVFGVAAHRVQDVYIIEYYGTQRRIHRCVRGGNFWAFLPRDARSEASRFMAPHNTVPQTKSLT